MKFHCAPSHDPERALTRDPTAGTSCRSEEFFFERSSAPLVYHHAVIKAAGGYPVAQGVPGFHKQSKRNPGSILMLLDGPDAPLCTIRRRKQAIGAEKRSKPFLRQDLIVKNNFKALI